ncbi:MAG TPA: 50S ribosomal protein L4 [Ktedonobacterales bacterium]|jgi:large subunit ribosomal protein L4
MGQPQANVYSMTGEVLRTVDLDRYVFDAPINRALLHQVVTAQLVNRRQGDASTKTRGQVSGGNKKPYRQKGTGRARQGSTRAPHFRGGGAVFGPHPHPYENKVPRKMRRIAIRAALTDRALHGKLLLVDHLNFDAPRTKDMLAFVEALPIHRNVLMLMPKRNEHVLLSARNIHMVKMGHVSSVNVAEILTYEYLLLPVAAMEWLVKVFGRDADDALDGKRHPALLARRLAGRAASAAQSGATAPAAAKPARTSRAAKASAKAADAPATTPGDKPSTRSSRARKEEE